MIPRSFRHWSSTRHAMAAFALCALAALMSYVWAKCQANAVDDAQQSLQRLKTSRPQTPRLQTPTGSPQRKLSDQWQPRSSIDEVVHQASLSAASLGVGVKTLAVSHQAQTPTAWGRVAVDVSATGSYSAMKSWQASMAHRFPALAVQSLRLQTDAAHAAGLSAQWVWVLHVRD